MANRFEKYRTATTAAPSNRFAKYRAASAEEQAPSTEAGLWDRVKDTGIDLAKGVVGLGESAVGVADLATGNLVGRGLARIGYDPQRTREILESGYSTERQTENAEVQAAEGFLDTIVATLKNPSVAAGTIVESSPMLLGAASTIRAAAMNMLSKRGLQIGSKEAADFLKSAPVRTRLAAIGSATEGAMAAGSNQEQARQEGRTYGESAGYSVAAGAGTAVIGQLASRVPGLGDIETAVGTTGMGRQTQQAIGKRMAAGMLQEGVLEEMPQSAQEQIFSNLALGNEWNEGVPEAAGIGLIAGAGMGGVVRALERREDPVSTINRIMDAPDIDSAIAAADEILNRPAMKGHVGPDTSVRLGLDGALELNPIDPRAQPAPGTPTLTTSRLEPRIEPGAGIPGIDFQTDTGLALAPIERMPNESDEAFARRSAELDAQARARREQDFRPALDQRGQQEADTAATASQYSAAAMPTNPMMRQAFEKARAKAQAKASAVAPSVQQAATATQQEAPAAPTPLVRRNGEPFQSRKSAEISYHMRDNPGATVVPVGNGFGVLPAVDTSVDTSAPAVDRTAPAVVTAASTTPSAPASNEVEKINTAPQVIDAEDRFVDRQREELKRQAEQAYQQEDAEDARKAARDESERATATVRSIVNKSLNLKDARDLVIKQFGPERAAEFEPQIKAAHNEKQQARRRKIRDDDSLRTAIAKLGGIGTDYRMDITGDSKRSTKESVPGTPGVFNQNGTSPDDMVTKLWEAGYITQANIDNRKDNGGVNLLGEMLRNELSGRKKHYQTNSSKPIEDQLRQAEEENQARIDQDTRDREQRLAEFAAEHGQEAAGQMRQHEEALLACNAELDRLIELEQEAELTRQREEDNEDINQAADEADTAEGRSPVTAGEIADEAGGRKTAAPATAAAPESGFELNTQTEESLRAEAAARDEVNSQAEKAAQAAASKANADKEVSTFTLAGSTRTADVGASRGQGGFDLRPADASTKTERGTVGMKLAAGQSVLTSSGRTTTPFPRISLDTNRKAINTIRAVDKWLHENALTEAQSRGDQFNARGFGAMNAAKLSQSDKDSLEEYLFGEQPAVVRSMLRPLVDAGAHQAATSPLNDLPLPTDAQKEAGNYRKGHVTLQGLDITIENPKGSTRSGTSPDGDRWENKMIHHYGYIKRTEGADGEQVDVFVGPDIDSEKVFIVDQVNADGSFDEHKVMLGFTHKLRAKAGYSANYAADWKVGPITEMSMDEFKAWLASGDNTKPASGPMPSKALTTGMEVEFGDKRYPVSSVQDAQKKWDAFQAQTGAGVSEIGNGVPIFQDGIQVARISYNGRAWDMDDNEIGGSGARAPKRSLPAPKKVNTFKAGDRVQHNDMSQGTVISSDGDMVTVKFDDSTNAPRPMTASVFTAIEKGKQTESPAFKRWFGDSKVVDANGQPLMVYHGTRPGNDFTEFDVRGVGAYFTPDPGYAAGFTNDISGEQRGNGSIMPTYLSIQNPKIVRAEEGSNAWNNFVRYRPLISEIEADGYDGAMLIDAATGEIDQIIATRPHQIKSAIGNVGTFDPASPDILFSQDRIPNQVEVGEFKTGQPVTFRYMHNTNSATAIFGKPKKDSKFGRYYEPSGRYVGVHTGREATDRPEIEYGTLTFQNPLVILNDDLGWKKSLSEFYGGKRGKALSLALIADGYDGIVTVDKASNGSLFTTETVDLTTFDEAKALYSQDGPRLSVLHNISADKIVAADKLGGLAVPSLGIVRDDMSIEGFGDVTLIGKSHLGDPAREDVYDADAWTATFPLPEYAKVSSKKAQALVDEIRPFVEKYHGRRAPILDATWDNAVNRANPDRIVNEWARDNAIKAMYIIETTGVQPRIPMTSPQLSHSASAHPAIIEFFRTREPGSDNGANSDSAVANRKAIREPFTKALQAKYVSLAENDPEIAQSIIEHELNDAFNERGEMKFARYDRMHNDQQRVGTQVVNVSELETSLDKKLKGKEPQFHAWITQKVMDIFGDPFVMIGRKRMPYTIHNIVESISEKGEKGSQEHITFGPGKARAVASKKFTDVQWMRNVAKDGMKQETALKEDREAAEKLLEEYRNSVHAYYEGRNWRGEIDTWNALDDSMRALAHWAKNYLRRGNEAALREGLRKNNFKSVPSSIVQKGIAAGRAMMEAPVPYFEAKPKRIVRLDEFAGAVVPSNASKEAIAVLEKHGIKVRKYPNRFNEEERRAAVVTLRNQLSRKGGDVLFQGIIPSRLIADVTSGGMTVEAVREAIAPAVKALNQQFDLDVIIMPSMSSMPTDRLGDIDPAQQRARGAYMDGAVYLFADRIPDARTARVTLAHELVGHKGVLEAATPEEWADIRTTIANLVQLRNAAAMDIMAEVKRRYPRENPTVQYKEFLAVAAERREKRGAIANLVEKVKAILRRMLKSVGLTGPFGESEIEIILANSERYLRESGRQSMEQSLAMALEAEREEMRAAKAKRLPMDRESRLARARAMGFDTSKVWYHGTGADFAAFTPSARGIFGKGVYVSSNPETASSYAHSDFTYGTFGQLTNKKKRGQPNVIAVYARGKPINGVNDNAVFRPEQLRSINAAFDPDYEESSELLAATTAPTFYSAALEAARALKQDRGTPEQMLAMLRKSPGVKKEELEWIGIEQYLSGLGKSVTRQQIVDFIEANGVQVETVVIDENTRNPNVYAIQKKDLSPEDRAKYDKLKNYAEAPEDAWFVFNDGLFGWYMAEDEENALNLASEDMTEGQLPAPQGTQFNEYVTPGGANYREVLLTLPTKKPARVDTMSRADLAAWYEEEVGYNPIEDSPSMTDEELRELVRGFSGEAQGQVNTSVTEEYQSPHWEVPNVLAHVRMNDRRDVTGRKILFIEEVQSDWHQKGRKDGYKNVRRGPTPKTLPPGTTMYEYTNVTGHYFQVVYENGGAASSGHKTPELSIIEAWERQDNSGVADAPFKNNAWAELAVKQVLRMAVEGGYDAVAWTSGQQQVERYDLSKHIERITYQKDGNGIYDIWINEKGKPSGKATHMGRFEESKLDTVVGKEMAGKIVKGEGQQAGFHGTDKGKMALEGLDLKVGGEGMKTFYDQILTGLFKDIARKMDKAASVKSISIDTGITPTKNKKLNREQLSDLRDLLKKARNYSDEEFSEEYEGITGLVMPDDKIEDVQDLSADPSRRGQLFTMVVEYTNQRLAAEAAGVINPPSIAITPAMVDGARAGLPLFSRTAQTDTPEFKAWFGKSKVVDAKGEPLVVYHGTKGNFENFDSSKVGSNFPFVKKGFFFSSDPDVASDFAAEFGGSVDGASVLPAYVSIKNPLTLEAFKAQNDIARDDDDGGEFDSVIEMYDWLQPEILKAVSAGQHDGVIFDDGNEKLIVAFDAAQIKSAIGNSGAFDPNNPSILFSQGSQFETENRLIREEDNTLWQRIRTELRRQLTPAGLLPDSVFRGKIDRDNKLAVVEFEAAHLIGELERAIRQDYKVHAGNLSEADQIALSEALGGKIPASVTGKTKDALIAMRMHIDNQSKGYIQILREQIAKLPDGDVKQAKMDLMQTITSNDGEYVHRSYRAFDDPNWFKAIPDQVLNDARDYLMQRLEQSMPKPEALKRARVIIEDIVKEGTAYDSMEAFVRESKLGAKDLSVLKQRKQIAPQIRALLGEYKDPRINYAKTVTKMGRLIWNQRFLDRVLDVGMGTFLFTEENRPANTTKIAAEGSETYSPLNGLYAPREIVQAFKDALGKEQMANWYRNIVQVNGAVKFGKTVLSPTTSFRNWQSAFFFTLANGHFDMTQMSKSVAGLKEYFFQSGDAAKLNYLKRLKDLGVVYDTPYAGEMMRLLQDSNTERFLTGAAAGMPLKAALNFAQKVYQYGDDFWKIIGFENEKNNLVRAGYTLAQAEVEAAERIRNTYPTYSMVGKGIQSLRRFPLAGTFVSFPAEIIRTSFNILKYIQKDLKDPRTRPLAYKRIAGMALASGMAYAAQAISKGLANIDDDDEEAVRLQAAPWQQNSNLLFTGRDEQGNLQYFDISFLDPYNYFKRPINAMLRDQPWQDAAVSGAGELLEPFFGTDILAGTIFEILANKKESGGEIYKETDDPTRQLAAITDHLRKAIQPGIASNLERTWQALEGQVSGTGRKYDLGDEGLAWVGWRVTTLDPKTALYYRSFDFNDAKSDASRTLTQVLTDPNDVDAGDIEQAYGLALRMRSRAYGDMAKMVSASQRSGLTDGDIRTVLRGASVSQADIAALLDGRVPAWVPTVQSERAAVRRAEAILGSEKAAEIRSRYRLARRQAVQ